jgi:hypothetical protein
MNLYFNPSVGTLPILPLIVFSTLSFRESCLNYILCYAFNYYHMHPWHLYILHWCLSHTCPLKSPLFHLIPSFCYVLLISPLAISSSLPRVSLDVTPFFVVLIPLALLCLHLFSYALVYYRLWPLRYLCLLPNCLPWTYPLKAPLSFNPVWGCELPISPLISFHSFLPYRFCVNSILCCVFYLLSPSYCHPSILPWYSSLFWLFKNLLSSTSIWEWQSTYLALGRTLSFSICRSCLNSIIYGTYILRLMPTYLLSYILVRYYL